MGRIRGWSPIYTVLHEPSSLLGTLGSLLRDSCSIREPGRLIGSPGRGGTVVESYFSLFVGTVAGTVDVVSMYPPGKEF